MPEALGWLASALAGACAAVAVLAAGLSNRPQTSVEWLPRRPAGAPTRVVQTSPTVPAAGLAASLRRQMERAGWVETPERFCAAVAAAGLGLGVLGASTATALGGPAATILAIAGALAAPALAAYALHAAARRRRLILLGQLAPLLELVSLELSAGGSAVSALGTVTGKAGGQLAADLRGLLVATQVSGSLPFEARLDGYADLHGLTPLRTLAALLRTAREYGSGVGEGIRALAADLRRARRRQLIAASRRALNRVLVPAAVGVLLPFVAILLYPAVSTLMGAFR
jgi:Flp pilus assembly protein TadB